MEPVVLASASARRQALLRRLVTEFAIDSADIDESLRPGEPPVDYAVRLAAEKARAVAGRHPPAAVVIGADTIVVLDDDVLGKPSDAAEARRFLDRLRGRRHLVITAVAVVTGVSGPFAGTEQTGVWLRAFSDAERDAYVATGDPLDKAGGYAIQHQGFEPVARVMGSETNVVGLPVRLTRRLLDLATNPSRRPGG
jgi:septum formation protein